MARQRTASTAETQVDDVAVYSDDECVQRLAALLEHKDTKAPVTLVKETVATSPQSVATLVYTWGGRREFEVRKDQEFSLKPVEEIKYKLVDVQPDKAVIVNTQQPDAPIEVGFTAP